MRRQHFVLTTAIVLCVYSLLPQEALCKAFVPIKMPENVSSVFKGETAFQKLYIATDAGLFRVEGKELAPVVEALCVRGMKSIDGELLGQADEAAEERLWIITCDLESFFMNEDEVLQTPHASSVLDVTEPFEIFRSGPFDYYGAQGTASEKLRFAKGATGIVRSDSGWLVSDKVKGVFLRPDIRSKEGVSVLAEQTHQMLELNGTIWVIAGRDRSKVIGLRGAEQLTFPDVFRGEGQVIDVVQQYTTLAAVNHELWAGTDDGRVLRLAGNKIQVIEIGISGAVTAIKQVGSTFVIRTGSTSAEHLLIGEAKQEFSTEALPASEFLTQILFLQPEGKSYQLVDFLRSGGFVWGITNDHVYRLEEKPAISLGLKGLKLPSETLVFSDVPKVSTIQYELPEGMGTRPAEAVENPLGQKELPILKRVEVQWEVEDKYGNRGNGAVPARFVPGWLILLGLAVCLFFSVWLFRRLRSPGHDGGKDTPRRENTLEEPEDDPPDPPDPSGPLDTDLEEDQEAQEANPEQRKQIGFPIKPGESSAYEFDYQELQVVAKGGMGVVLRGVIPNSRDPVALKLLRNDNRSPEAKDRLMTEAAILRELDHPSIVGFHKFDLISDVKSFDSLKAHGLDVEEFDFFIEMEWIEGVSVRELIKKQPEICRQNAKNILLEVASGLAHLHSKGIVHRDLKPENIVFDIQMLRSKIIDFGVAKKLRGTLNTKLIGTPFFIAPEQTYLDGIHIERWTDVFGFGALMADILTLGKAHDRFSMLSQTNIYDVRNFLIGYVRPDVVSLILSCLKQQYEDRPTIDAVLLEIRNFDSLFLD